MNLFMSGWLVGSPTQTMFVLFPLANSNMYVFDEQTDMVSVLFVCIYIKTVSFLNKVYVFRCGCYESND